MTTIGFIGLGHMGAPMVENLLRNNGFIVKIFDIDLKAVHSLMKKGAIKTDNIVDAVKESDVIMTMVQTGDQVRQCCLGAQGIFEHMKPNALYIDSSTIDIKTSKELHAYAEEKKKSMLDAPVSGGVAAAVSATLTFMVGGDEKKFQQGKHILEHLGKHIIYAGVAGSGVAAKICNNMLLGISMIGVCESFVLAERLGLAPEKLFEICATSSGQCWSLTQYCPWPNILDNVPSSHAYRPGFTGKMMLKDLLLSQDAADFADVHVRLGEHATKLFQKYVDEGKGDMDFSGIIHLLKTRDLK